MHVISRSLFALSALGLFSQLADAHVSISSGPAGANKSQVLTFDIGHGCEDSTGKDVDTLGVRITIPAGVTSIRGLHSDFGKPTLVRTGSVVTAVEWTKDDADELPGDEAFYQVKLRARIPDAPFSKLKFVVTQFCKDSATGAPITAVWDQDEGATTGNPAPFLTVVPARTSGWQKFTVPRAITQDEMPAYFGDAAIVWKGTAAYSSNAQTAAMISTTAGVTALTGGLAASDEVWVKY